jgi:hypothetical protein
MAEGYASRYGFAGVDEVCPRSSLPIRRQPGNQALGGPERSANLPAALSLAPAAGVAVELFIQEFQDVQKVAAEGKKRGRVSCDRIFSSAGFTKLTFMVRETKS